MRGTRAGWTQSSLKPLMFLMFVHDSLWLFCCTLTSNATDVASCFPSWDNPHCTTPSTQPPLLSMMECGMVIMVTRCENSVSRHSVDTRVRHIVAQPCLCEVIDCTPCRVVGSSPVPTACQQPHQIDGRLGSYRHLLDCSLVLSQQPLNGFLSSTGIRCLTLYPDLFRVTISCEQCFSPNDD